MLGSRIGADPRRERDLGGRGAVLAISPGAGENARAPSPNFLDIPEASKRPPRPRSEAGS